MTQDTYTVPRPCMRPLFFQKKTSLAVPLPLTCGKNHRCDTCVAPEISASGAGRRVVGSSCHLASAKNPVQIRHTRLILIIL